MTDRPRLPHTSCIVLNDGVQTVTVRPDRPGTLPLHPLARPQALAAAERARDAAASAGAADPFATGRLLPLSAPTSPSRPTPAPPSPPPAASGPEGGPAAPFQRCGQRLGSRLGGALLAPTPPAHGCPAWQRASMAVMSSACCFPTQRHAHLAARVLCSCARSAWRLALLTPLPLLLLFFFSFFSFSSSSLGALPCSRLFRFVPVNACSCAALNLAGVAARW
jgi:hypothetical protein